MPESAYVAEGIELNVRSRQFNGCIGAIDGTHIPAFIPSRYQRRFYNRKSNITQNVFAAVGIDGRFLYVLAGAEGSMNDASLFVQTQKSRRFRIPSNRFFLGDAGFGMAKGIITPYPNTRYHLQDWAAAERAPNTPKELYNLGHARIRCVVEQAFGILKRRWKIIRHSAPEYSFQTQIGIVYACCALHNFVLDLKDKPAPSSHDIEQLEQARERAQQRVEGVAPSALRDQIAERHWEQYQQYLASRRTRQSEQDTI